MLAEKKWQDQKSKTENIGLTNMADKHGWKIWLALKSKKTKQTLGNPQFPRYVLLSQNTIETVETRTAQWTGWKPRQSWPKD